MSFVKNVHFDATEHGDKIIFLHTVNAGPANQSYGIQVAQLAGVPRPVIQLAKQKLHELENQVHAQVAEPQQIDLFAIKKEEHPALMALKELNPNALSPMEALTLLFKLKEQAHV